MIPSVAVEVILGKLLLGNTPPWGARPATHDISLADYEAIFKRRRIYIGRRDMPASHAPLYRRILQDQWLLLPKAVRQLHDLQNSKSVEGKARVERGKGVIVGTIATLFGFPKAGIDIPVRVNFTPRNGQENWQRVFADKTLRSIQFEGHGRYENLICERFGPITLGLAVITDDRKLHLVIRRWDFLGLPLPLFLAPRVRAYETEEAGKFHFYVEISLPFAGDIVRYQGWLA